METRDCNGCHKRKGRVVRRAKVKTTNGIVERAIQHLYPLELTCDDMYSQFGKETWNYRRSQSQRTYNFCSSYTEECVGN